MSTDSLIVALQILRIVTAILIVLILGYIGYIMISFKNMVPFVPTSKKVAKKMVELAGVKKGDKVIDLGSGTGSIVMAAASSEKDITVVGVELSPLLRLITKLKLLLRPRLSKRISIIRQDMFNVHLSPYAVIFCFITPEAIKKLLPKFRQLPRGTKIVTHMFSLPSIEGFDEQIHHINEKTSVYVYTKQ